MKIKMIHQFQSLIQSFQSTKNLVKDIVPSLYRKKRNLMLNQKAQFNKQLNLNQFNRRKLNKFQDNQKQKSSKKLFLNYQNSKK
jgi:hypothetical protein